MAFLLTKFWQDNLSNSRTNDMHDLLIFGKDVKVFLKKD